AWHESRYVRVIPKPVTDVFTCEHCDKKFTPKVLTHRVHRFCSRRCKDFFRGEAGKAARVQSKGGVIRCCIWCGSVMPAIMRVDARFCSRKCGQAAHNSVKKLARRSGETRNEAYLRLRMMLYERDGPHCSLCGEELSLLTKHPDPLYASIDHV